MSNGFNLFRYTDQCVSKFVKVEALETGLPKIKMTFVDVLVQLVDKSIQLLPLLAGKLQCITRMNPLTQRTADTHQIRIT